MTVATVEWLGLSQAANQLGCSAQTVRAMAKRGELTCFESPLGRLVAAEDVERLVTERAARMASKNAPEDAA